MVTIDVIDLFITSSLQTKPRTLSRKGFYYSVHNTFMQGLIVQEFYSLILRIQFWLS